MPHLYLTRYHYAYAAERLRTHVNTMDNSIRKNCNVRHENCTTALDSGNFSASIDLSFLDPPFNQDKVYKAWDDNLPPEKYWDAMRDICAKVYALTSDGGAIYFMQREKNTELVLECLLSNIILMENFLFFRRIYQLKRNGKCPPKQLKQQLNSSLV